MKLNTNSNCNKLIVVFYFLYLLRFIINYITPGQCTILAADWPSCSSQGRGPRFCSQSLMFIFFVFSYSVSNVTSSRGFILIPNLAASSGVNVLFLENSYLARGKDSLVRMRELAFPEDDLPQLGEFLEAKRSTDY